MTNRVRFSGIFNASTVGATIIGLGGIGATAALALAKMGVGYLTLVDDDTVSEENIATQLYATHQIGYKKAIALRDLLALFVDDVYIDHIVDRVTAETPWYGLLANDIVISAVDSISSRAQIWRAICDKSWRWYIDARMGAEQLAVYVIDNERLDWYDSVLSSQDDDVALEEPCTAKATIYTANAAAAVIGKTVRQIVSGERPPAILSWNIHKDTMFAVGGKR